MSKLLENHVGSKSSKRVAGISMLAGGSVMAITLFTFSLFRTVADSSTALTVLKTMFTGGVTLLGVGVVEMFSGKK